MRAIIISAVFSPEPVVSAQTSESLACALVLRNHKVSLITNFPNRPDGIIYKGYKRSLFSIERDSLGYVINRCFSTFSKTSSIFSRLLENISFGITSSLILFFHKKPDVVYSNSWPIFATGLTVLVCKLRKVPIIVSVQDIYPESLFVQGRIAPNHVLFKLLVKIDKWIAKKADSLILISQKQAMSYISSRNIKPEKVHVIPNWMEKDSIQLLPKDMFRKEAGISSDAFLIVYGGNIGKAAGLQSVIQALHNFKADKEVILLVAGSGSELAECQLLAEQSCEVKIIFHTPWVETDTSKVLAAADLLLLPTHGNQSLVSVPSKLIAYMLSSKPILAITSHQSETGSLVEGVDCGWVIESDNLEFLSSKIIEISESFPIILNKKGARGREFALGNFTSEVALPKIISLLEEIVREKA